MRIRKPSFLASTQIYSCRLSNGRGGYLVCYCDAKVLLIYMLNGKLEEMFGYYLSSAVLEILYSYTT